MATGMVQAKPEGSGTYTYSSQPRAVQQDKKYRDQSAYGNIMYDRRIVRGNTYALHTLPASSQPDPLELQRQQESRRRALARKRAREQFKPRSPEPVEGRKHIEVQTELYLEEITDRVEEADVQTQTDAFLDRPSTPLFVPAKTGMDTGTQIEEGDLFDFDIEVRPILEVLVGKTVEQALLEVMEEEELASLRAQQRVFEENRNAEFVETQRLEEQERRHREEKERRMQQQREALLKEKETAEKIAARAFAQSYLADLVPSVFSTLNQNGFFYDPVEREVETVFMPYLMEETEKALNKRLVARTLLDAIIRNMVASKFGIEISDPEPAPPTQEEPSPASDQQADQKDLPKVFGDEKHEGEAVGSEEAKEIQPSPAEIKEGEGESDLSPAETSKPADEGPAETEKTESVREDQPVDVKPGDSEGAESSPVVSKDSAPVEKEDGDGEQPATESKDSEVAVESKTTTDDTPEAVAATAEEPGTQSEETTDKQKETVENKADGEPSTGETVQDETKTVQDEPLEAESTAPPPPTEEQS